MAEECGNINPCSAVLSVSAKAVMKGEFAKGYGIADMVGIIEVLEMQSLHSTEVQ